MGPDVGIAGAGVGSLAPNGLHLLLRERIPDRGSGGRASQLTETGREATQMSDAGKRCGV